MNAAAGPRFVPIDSQAEAARKASAQRFRTDIGLAAGGPVFTGLASGAQLAGAPDDVVNNLGIAQAGLVGSAPNGGRIIEPVGQEKFNLAVDSYINGNKQERHILNGKGNADKGYFNNLSDAQDVLSAYQRDETEILGRGSDGGHIVRYDDVTGFNVNRNAGYIDQPTNIF